MAIRDVRTSPRGWPNRTVESKGFTRRRPGERSEESAFVVLKDLQDSSSPSAPQNDRLSEFSNKLLGIAGEQHYESSMNMSFAIQQSVGFETVVEASYVGAFRRHNLQFRDINAIPMFSQCNPEYMDPWSAYNPKRSTNNDNPRPLQGLGRLQLGYYEGSKNYNALQVSVRRALRRGLSYGLAYTCWLGRKRQDGCSGQPHSSIRSSDLLQHFQLAGVHAPLSMQLDSRSYTSTRHWAIDGLLWECGCGESLHDSHQAEQLGHDFCQAL